MEEIRPCLKSAVAPSLDRQKEQEDDIVFRKPVKSKTAERLYHTSPHPPRPEFERLQAKLKDL